MKTLYLDCGMGAAGDMLTGALLALLDKDAQAAFLREINAALGERAEVTAEPALKCGVRGLHVHVRIGGVEEGQAHGGGCGHHPHSSIREIQALLGSLPLSEAVRTNAGGVFDCLARAESEVHSVDMEHIHFHEIGSIDAVADVLGVCMLMEKLRPDEVIASPVNVGGGTVKCAHGVLPVPAPATELLLRGIPWYEGEIRTELCTPTGAALLRWFAGRFERVPVLRVEKCGYGMGTKDFGRLNAVRALLGVGTDAPEELCEFACNLDDMTGEELGFAMERLFDAGALDCWTTAIGMKKSRPGVMLSALCRPEQRDAVLACLFRHTTTLGVREQRVPRHSLRRSFRTAQTPWGEVTVKRAEGRGVTREKPEYEELARLAREHGLSLREVREKLET